MNRAIILDTGPIGLVTNPRLSAESIACAQWLQTHVTAENRVMIPEIADYGVLHKSLSGNLQTLTDVDSSKMEA